MCVCVHRYRLAHACLHLETFLEEFCNVDAWTMGYVFIKTGDKNRALMEKVIVIHDFQMVNSIQRIHIKPSHSPSMLAGHDGWKCQVP